MEMDSEQSAPIVSAMSLGRRMKCDHIYKIPAEIRTKIFRFAVKEDEPILISGEVGIPALAVLRTCRTFRKEATICYYQENTFLLADPESALIWMSRIEDYHRHIHHLHLEADISPLEQSLWGKLGITAGGFDGQWKALVEMAAASFKNLEDLSLVVVAHHLQALHGPDAEPRQHRYADLAPILEGYHTGQASGHPLLSLKTSCPKFESLQLITPFDIDWAPVYLSTMNLVEKGVDKKNQIIYGLADPPPPPEPVVISSDEEDDESDSDEDESDEDETDDEEDDEGNEGGEVDEDNGSDDDHESNLLHESDEEH